MNSISPLAILLLGIAIGACLPILVTSLRAWRRHRWFKPTLLHLDEVPSQRRAPAAAPTDLQP